ncbi:hemolysin III family protein [Planococcus sp. N028]|uniref:Hemolysin III family protein n=1 Tax=Planococcus shixiaomingii TaxID=3058393 RepID=A0ABT8N5Q9_9BACL|nr:MULTISPECIES: hemolysin III family protein [unclassified Planococcus (in: firmicutes)]MDN7243220.1 hemolysin III family protein [Planococcus sp. N028]WKA55163.1 hemolysin III family protein [Planococcus sp. N022]
MTTYIREPFNALSHLAGAVLSFIAFCAMMLKAAYANAPALHVAAVMIFGISLMCLYLASAIYHTAIAAPKTIAFLRKLDHSMIFALIAGSYAPFCLIALGGTLGWVLFGFVAVIGLSGILFKMVWFHSPRWLSTALYIAMGWIIIFAIVPLVASMPLSGLLWLVVGGLSYTLGGIIYGLKPDFMSTKYLGFHEIFHLFILFGSLCHFIAVYFYVL